MGTLRPPRNAPSSCERWSAARSRRSRRASSSFEGRGGAWKGSRAKLIVDRMTDSTETARFPPPKAFSEPAHIKSLAQYRELYERSLRDPEGFWSEQARRLQWSKPWDKV